MSELLKQRLVGALILLALGVVFWPIVFVEPDDKSSLQPQSIPEPPEISTSAIEPPDEAGLRGSPTLSEFDESEQEYTIVDVEPEGADAGATDVPPTAAVTRTEAPQPLAMDADGVPVAWTLQVATVSTPEKAEALRRRLLDKSEKAYVTTVTSGGKQLYRVSVGPKFERQELERIQDSINAEFGVKTLLVRYYP